ncbi:TIGR03747 family integrating conjugative element membrane protein [Hydrogenophaga atypica]|uniref:TIGR03747 family integrating conjugative element membrane protein n=1 Tax=Hydrogenophaga atypica TaxID=249409 RepID=A0ABW2QLQ2_9BURK
MSTPAPRGPVRPRTRGPIEIVLEVTLGLFFLALFSWFVGLLIEIGGMYTLWKGEGSKHIEKIVQQDLEHIAAAPRSLLIRDTVGFSHKVVRWVHKPYERSGLLRWYASHRQNPDTAQVPTLEGQPSGITRGTRVLGRMFSEWVYISMWVLMDVLLRLSVAMFALPAFVLACMVGVVDGLVRRDLRRWGGGRESSFIYHHAKRYTGWALTGGFGLYLTWPFGGFNPAYMVLVFTVLVAFTLSTTVGAFKKYA